MSTYLLIKIIWSNSRVTATDKNYFENIPGQPNSLYKINPGTLNKIKTSIPEYILAGKMINGIPSIITYIRQARPNEKAIGNRNIKQTRKTINSTAVIIFL